MSVSPDPVDLLKSKLQDVQDCYARLVKLFKVSQNYGKTKVTLFELARNEAINIRAEFTQIQKEVNTLNAQVDEKAQLDLKSKIANQFDDIIDNLRTAYAEAIDASNKPATQRVPTAAVTTASEPQHLKLKPLEIAPFTNEILDFPRFIRLFESLYGRHPSLSNTEKFYYLQQSLQGEALALVNTFELSDTGYTNALQALKDRFQSPRILAATIAKELLSFVPAKKQSTDSLRTFLKVHQDHVSTLKSLPGIADLSDFLLLTIASRSLDSLTRKLFESKMADKPTIPTYNDLIKFVTQQVSTLELISNENSSQANSLNKISNKATILHVGNTPRASSTQAPTLSKQPKTINSHRANNSNTNQPYCIFCATYSDHQIGRCSKFNSYSLQQRNQWVNQSNRCNCCLSSKHITSKCQSTKNCIFCSSKQHHSLLCPTKNSGSESSSNQSKEPQPSTSSSAVMSCTTNSSQDISACTSTVILGTFQAKVSGVKSDQLLRIILDTGSTKNLISEEAVRALDLPIKPDNSILAGVGGNQMCTLGCVDLVIQSRFTPSFQLKFNANVIPKITDPVQPIKFYQDVKNVLSTLTLADSEILSSSSNPIHILLSVSQTMKILAASQVPIPLSQLTEGCHSIDSLLYGVTSPFGIIISGEISGSTVKNHSSNDPNCLLCNDCSETSIKDFFIRESVIESDIPVKNEDEIYAETHFQKNHSRAENGKFIVRLPFKPNFPDIGFNRNKALAFLYSSEKKMKSDPFLYSCYQSALQDFLDKGEIIPSKKCNNYILNQHVIVKKSNNKAKIVFNPAVKGGSYSLNDSLLPGPKLQRDLNYILLSARAHPVALACDIDNFYRSIALHPDDAEKLHILTRLDENSNVSQNGVITDCSLNHLCYGLTCSPFLALRCIDELCNEIKLSNSNTYKRDSTGNLLAVNVLQYSRYIDDFFFSAPSVSTCVELKNDLTDILSKGQFTLSKFISSHAKEMNFENHKISITFKDKITTPILGCLWDPGNDIFKFELTSFSGEVTRRSCTSFLAKCFDSQGLISPVIFYLKRFVQMLWIELPTLGWDKPIPEKLASEWISFTNQMPLLSQLSIPRYCTAPNCKQFVCIFSDASNAGYSSAAYIVSVSPGNANVSHLLISKTKVAPLKAVRTIPQLELAGIELSAKIINWILNGNLPYHFEAIYGYSDSMIALAYLNIPVSKLKTYVANRVSNIHNLTAGTNVTWLYCSTHDNPADLASRGCQPQTIINNTVWFNGPTLLQTDFPPSDCTDSSKVETPYLPDVKQAVLTATTTPESNPIFELTEKISDFGKLRRITSYVLRFIRNCKLKKQERSDSLAIAYSEITNASNCLVNCIQNCQFPGLAASLAKGKCPANLSSLTPFVDPNGLIRVGGRLEHANLEFESKHPLLLPKNCNFSKIICRYYHTKCYHGGSNLSIGLLRATYWITHGKQLMKSVIHKCTICGKWNPKHPSPIQGQIPAYRLESTFPFRNSVGLDCMGPYQFKLTQRKNSPSAKLWGLIFVCEATRASHIEVLTSMNAKHFLAAVDRYTARRATPRVFRADCGSNFTAGFKQLSEFARCLTENKDSIISELGSRSIEFQHIPAYTPWMGSWEPMVKCCKKLLKVLLTEPMYLEEYITTFTKVESMMNSRPYLEPSNDIKDGLELLCPANFLVGGPFATAPSPPIENPNDIKPHCRWDRIKSIINQFWKRWHKEVLHTLMQTNKWKKGDKSDLKENQLVWVPDTRSNPASWPIGKISKIYPDSKGIVRVVDVTTASGILRRAARNLVIIPT